MSVKDLIVWLLKHPMDAQVNLSQPGCIGIEQPEGQQTLQEWI